ncbi:hypothetical protein LXL04_012151 [Taraxacum kok-saghyz]
MLKVILVAILFILIESDGRKLISGLIPDAGTIHAHGSDAVQIPLCLIYDDIKNTYEDIQPGSIIPYKVKVDLIVDVPVFGRITILSRKTGKSQFLTVSKIDKKVPHNRIPFRIQHAYSVPNIIPPSWPDTPHDQLCRQKPNQAEVESRNAGEQVISTMASGSAVVALERKRKIVTALCKSRSLDPAKFLDNVDNDLKSLSINIATAALENNVEFNKWVTFAEKFLLDPEACSKSLTQLNEYLTEKAVLVGGGFTPSEADIIVFSTVHPSVISLSVSEKNKLPHLMRWMDYIQSKHEFKELFDWIVVEKAPFDPPLPKSSTKVESEAGSKKSESSTKKPEPNAKASSSKAESEKKTDVPKKQPTEEKKKVPEKAAADEKDKELSVSLLKIQVGLIRKASKHPSADSLLVEEIDVGESKCRQVVSGLAKFCTPEELTNRLVALITNVKPGKLRDVVSEGLVLCASNADHTAVEPLIVPQGAKIGECVTFSGHEGKPEEVLNPKKKQLDKITPNLFTDEKGVATFKGVPFMTSGGPCTSSLPKAIIK